MHTPSSTALFSRRFGGVLTAGRLIVGSLFVSTAALAWPPTATNLQEVGIRGLNLVTISCSPIWNAAKGSFEQQRATCTHTTVRISRPTRADIERDVARLTTPEARRELEGTFPTKCAELSAMSNHQTEAANIDLPEPTQIFLQEASAACRANNLLAFIEAAKRNIRTLKAFTCKIEHYPARELAFEMRNENQWQAVTTAPNRTDVLVLWRSSSESTWNLKQVTTASPTCQGPLCPKDQIIEWRSDVDLTLRDCRYFDRG